MEVLKVYKCPYGHYEWTDRRTCRKQIQEYIITDKEEQKGKQKRSSNITNKMIMKVI